MKGTQAVNPERGEVLLEVKDDNGLVQESFVLIMKTNAIATLEKLLEQPIHVIGAMMARRNPGVGELRAMLLAALVSRQPEFTLEAAGDLIDDAGFTAVLDAVLEALRVGFPQAMEKAKAGAGKAQSRGTGAGSSPTPRRRGSDQKSSGT